MLWKQSTFQTFQPETTTFKAIFQPSRAAIIRHLYKNGNDKRSNRHLFHRCFCTLHNNVLKATESKRGCLYVVSTPIGNLNDASSRCLETLRNVDIIAAEDTRLTDRLLQHFGIQKTQMSLHEHNTMERIPKLMALFECGKSVALVSDAGTPCISDPGYLIVQACHEKNIPVFPIPGACALTAALSVCGFHLPPFSFYGFIPVKGSTRKEILNKIRKTPHVVVLYESPHRLIRTLNDLVEYGMGTKRVLVARELTKVFEELHWNTVAGSLEYFRDKPIKGEFTLVLEQIQVENKHTEHKTFTVDEILGTLLAENMNVSSASKVVAKLFQFPKQEVYQRGLSINKISPNELK
eukprot:jgi/Galph1/464/GphlegSOOS_G5142.1